MRCKRGYIQIQTFLDCGTFSNEIDWSRFGTTPGGAWSDQCTLFSVSCAFVPLAEEHSSLLGVYIYGKEFISDQYWGKLAACEDIPATLSRVGYITFCLCFRTVATRFCDWEIDVGHFLGIRTG